MTRDRSDRTIPFDPLPSDAESFAHYANAIREVSLLTAEEERGLSRAMQLARADMTRAVADIPAAIQQFLAVYEGTKENQWELANVVSLPSQATQSAPSATGEDGSASDSPIRIMEREELDQVVSELMSRYVRWQLNWVSVSSTASDEARAARRGMGEVFATLPVAPHMLRLLCATCRNLYERVEEAGSYSRSRSGPYQQERRMALLSARRGLEAWGQAPSSARAQGTRHPRPTDMRQVEMEAGADVASIRQAYVAADAARRRYERAWRALVEANLRLVITIARPFVRKGMTLVDLVQEGNLGLFRAAEKFDYRLGYRFSTYASFWIRQAVSRALPKQGRLIPVPRYMYDHIILLNALRAKLQQRLGRNPTLEELAEASRLPMETVRTALSADQTALSLDRPLTEEEDHTRHDRIPDHQQADPADRLNEVQIADGVSQLLDTLPQREALILRLHYGIGGIAPLTLEQIAAIIGVTRERVRQLEVNALKALHREDASRLLESLSD